MAKLRKRVTLRRRCDKCPVRFFSFFCLFLHLKVHERVYSGWFNCFRCRKRFKSIIGAVKHRQRHVPKAKICKNITKNTPKEIHNEDVSISNDNMISDSQLAVKSHKEDVKEGQMRKEEQQQIKTKEMLALEFVEQLKMALSLDTESVPQEGVGTADEFLQISEVSSSENPEHVDTAYSKSGKESNPEDQPCIDQQKTSLGSQDVVHTSFQVSNSTEISHLSIDNMVSESQSSGQERRSKDGLLHQEESLDLTYQGKDDRHSTQSCQDPFLGKTDKYTPPEYDKTSSWLSVSNTSSYDGTVANSSVTQSNAMVTQVDQVGKHVPPLAYKKTNNNSHHLSTYSSGRKSPPVLYYRGMSNVPQKSMVLNEPPTLIQGKMLQKDTGIQEGRKIINDITLKLGLRDDNKTEIKTPRRYACCFCTAKFASFSRLRRHKRIVHNKLVTTFNAGKNADVDSEQTEERRLKAASEMPRKQTKEKNDTFQKKVQDDDVGSQDDYIDVVECSDDRGYLLSQNKGKEKFDQSPAGGYEVKELFKCKLCDATFLTSYGEEQHVLKRHSEGNKGIALQTKELDRELSTLNSSSCYNAMTQMEPVTLKAKATATCSFCGVVFNSVKEKRIHVLDKHGLEITYDNETFAFNGDKQAQPPILEITPQAKARMQEVNVENCYNSDKKFCNICNTSYLRWFDLRRHMIYKHNITAARPNFRKRELTILRRQKPDQNLGKVLAIAKSHAVADETKEQPIIGLSVNQVGGNKEKVEDKQRSTISCLFSCLNSAEKKVTWLANFAKKSFECCSCDFPFSGFFILRRHMKEKHAIILDSNGHAIEKRSKDATTSSTSDSAISDENQPKGATQKRSSDESFVRASSITQNIENVSDTEDIAEVPEDNQNSADNRMITVNENKNGYNQCPHCPAEFKSLIDRYIHIMDTHNKSRRSVKTQNESPEGLSFPQTVPKDGLHQFHPTTDRNNSSTLYGCKFCGSTFEQQQNLKRHMRRTHKANYQDNKLHESKTVYENRQNELRHSTGNAKASSNLKQSAIPQIKPIDADSPCLMDSSPMFTCRICRYTFSSWTSKCEHLTSVHNIKISANTARKSITNVRKDGIEKGATVAGYEGSFLPSTSNGPTSIIVDASSLRGSSGNQSDTSPKTTSSPAKTKIYSPPAKQARIDSKGTEKQIFSCDICLRCYSAKKSLLRHKREKHGSTRAREQSTDQSQLSQTQAVPKSTTHPGLNSNENVQKSQFNYANNSPRSRGLAQDECRMPSKESKSLSSTEESPLKSTFNQTNATLEKKKTVNNKALNFSNACGSFCCSQCKETFPSLKELEAHGKKHNAEHDPGVESKQLPVMSFGEESISKTHSCDVCSFAFQSAAHLQKHQLYGLCKKPLVCGIPGCGRQFASQASYKIHMEYTCTLCHNQLSSERNLGRHYRDVHKIRHMLNCDVCGEKFIEPISLAHHNREKHMGN